MVCLSLCLCLCLCLWSEKWPWLPPFLPSFHPSSLNPTPPPQQLVTKWCDAVGVANRGVGPVVFYKGFTREFLRGTVGTSADLLRDARESVEAIGRGKKVSWFVCFGWPCRPVGPSSSSSWFWLCLAVVVLCGSSSGRAPASF